jgi:hypothetical protein
MRRSKLENVDDGAALNRNPPIGDFRCLLPSMRFKGSSSSSVWDREGCHARRHEKLFRQRRERAD